MADLELRPLSLGEILDRTASLYRSHFVLFVGISGIPHLLVLAWTLGDVVFVGIPHARARALGAPPQEPSAASLLTTLLVFVLEAFVVYFFTQGPIAHAVSQLYLGRRTSIGSAFRRMGSRFFSLVGITLLSGTAIFAGMFVFVAPGIVLACRLILALPAAVVEGLTPGRAFARSFHLTRGNTGRAAAIYALYLLLRLVAYTPVLFLFRLVMENEAGDSALASVLRVLIALANVCGATVVAPFFMIAAVVFYFDLRVRKEALDLQIMMGSGDKIPAGPLAPY
jgi:hypothetical protein